MNRSYTISVGIIFFGWSGVAVYSSCLGVYSFVCQKKDAIEIIKTSTMSVDVLVD